MKRIILNIDVLARETHNSLVSKSPSNLDAAYFVLTSEAIPGDQSSKVRQTCRNWRNWPD